jgi:hypothetical protein
MATIPDNQQRIYLLIKEIERKIIRLAPVLRADIQSDLDAIRVCTVDCYRRKPLSVASVQSDPMDLAKRIQILQTRQAHPDWTQQKIGAHCNVIAGRVSEVLRGKRK